METSMVEFCRLLADFIHKELRTTLAHIDGWYDIGEPLYMYDAGREVWTFIHGWMAHFMNGRPAMATACKDACVPYSSNRWYVRLEAF